MKALPERGPACWCFTKGWGSATSRWSARAGSPVSAMSRSPPTCSAIGGRHPICRKSQPWSAGFAPSRKNSAPAAVPRSTALAALPQVDAGRLAAIGFCFGGSVVLELAREGAELKAVVSFHGVLATKMPAQPGLVKASVLVCTGVDDPLAPPEQLADFENEMRTGGVKDWQVIAYGNTLHGFTNPAADGSMMRTAMYNEQADRRSWASMKSLFDEVLT